MRTTTRVAIVGPVYPYRAGIAYCTTRLAEELRKSCEVEVISFARQYPKRFYPGGDDLDPTLPRAEADFLLDVLNPLTWLRAGWRLRKADAVVFVWWIWVWALPYRVMMAMLPRSTRAILQCHNIGDKEPAWWKQALTNLVLRRGKVLVTHAATEGREGWRRSHGRRTVTTFLPVHELGGAIPSRDEARKTLGIDGNVALFFGHVRPFKGLDVALLAWAEIRTDVLLLVAGEAWWERADEYRELATRLGLRQLTAGDRQGGGGAEVKLEFRFIPDAEIATYFAAADVVLAPYRIEAQSGVALTAFHFARPVIATRVGGLPEIIDGKNGMLVDAENPRKLAAAVDEFFTTRDRAAMEAAAAESARRYSWQEYGEVFRRLVDDV
jgi:glycosyltransferase involved in cell wall biosynthesis